MLLFTIGRDLRNEINKYQQNKVNFAHFIYSTVPVPCPSLPFHPYLFLLLPLFLLLFSFLLIQLPKLFPDLLMELSVSARKVPMFSFLPGEVQLGLPGMVTAFAVQNNATLTPLFKLQAVSTMVTLWDVLYISRVFYIAM